MRIEGIDSGSEFDWGLTSEDYARYRPGYPEEFYDLLSALGVGLPGQGILDLGTGTGVLARAFAQRGARVTAVDISEQQVAAAKEIAAQEGVEIDFLVSPAEQIEFPDGSFDLVSAGQSWLYFDASTMVKKVLRALTREGRLVLTHLLWLPRKDPIARASEQLVLEHNPDWSAADYEGVLPPQLPWARNEFELEGYHILERRLEFTRQAWRGRFRACRGVGASMSPERVEAFDSEHDELLRSLAGDVFEVWHQMTVHLFVRKGRLG